MGIRLLDLQAQRDRQERAARLARQVAQVPLEVLVPPAVLAQLEAPEPVVQQVEPEPVAPPVLLVPEAVAAPVPTTTPRGTATVSWKSRIFGH